jgi:hypothetical protein
MPTNVGSPAWQTAEAAANKLKGTTLRSLFASDPNRATTYTYDAGLLRVDL